ncbi:MAG: trypsin-like serine peptidase [Candidatus Avelusimicrobium sp.]|uniref:trypsin-like serine peptidase n=1 Tax=Candidatus Avelusimicrobium sp. TaxID=3048833 RepID=UPI003F0861BD
MNKKLLLVFAAIFSCSAAFAQTDKWTVYDLQTNEQKTVDLTDEPLMMPTAIVGRDDRKDITNKARGFEKAAVLLEAQNSTGMGSLCSGAMIGKNIVLTAAHCLTDSNNQLFPKVRVIAAGLAGGGDDVPPPSSKKTPKNPNAIKVPRTTAELYAFLLNAIKRASVASASTAEVSSSSPANASFSAKAVQLWVPSEWDIRQDISIVEPYDYGLIILDSNLGDQTGWLNVAVKSKADLLHKDIILLGRGGDKPQRTLWRANGTIKGVKDKYVYHNADMLSGNSGGPILLEEDPYTIVALNNFGPRADKSPEYSAPNGGLRINDEILKAIQYNGKEH